MIGISKLPYCSDLTSKASSPSFIAYFVVQKTKLTWLIHSTDVKFEKLFHVGRNKLLRFAKSPLQDFHCRVVVFFFCRQTFHCLWCRTFNYETRLLNLSIFVSPGLEWTALSNVSQKVRNCVTSPLNLSSVSFGNLVWAACGVSVPVPEFLWGCCGLPECDPGHEGGIGLALFRWARLDNAFELSGVVGVVPSEIASIESITCIVKSSASSISFSIFSTLHTMIIFF